MPHQSIKTITTTDELQIISENDKQSITLKWKTPETLKNQDLTETIRIIDINQDIPPINQINQNIVAYAVEGGMTRPQDVL